MLARTLNAKLIFALLVILALMSATFLLVTMWTTRQHNQEVEQSLQKDLAAHIVQHYNLMTGCESFEGEGDCVPNAPEMQRLFEHLMNVNPGIECYVLDPTGRLLSYSVPDESLIERDTVSVAPIEAFLRGNERFPLRGEDPRDAHGVKVFSAAPIGPAAKPDGYLYVVLGGQEYESVAQMLRGSYILRVTLWIALASLLLAALAGIGIFHRLTLRLRQLAATVDRFRRTDFTEDFRAGDYAETGDEIDRVGIACQRMARRIREQFDRIRRSDRMRRELVANVSHDLRTPLATLRGYLETLQLKESTLSDEDRRLYLDIALRHSEQLGHLISELFELSKLDSYDGELQREPFAVGELVHDVLQEFQLQASEREIDLRPALVGKLPFVLANVGLIERVLQNLVDNALRHTDRGGTVTVELCPEPAGRVTVRVQDDGCGIAEQDLPHVFERFYRRDRSEGPATGAGLGLAIAKRALELHGSEIKVKSRVGIGTLFSFQLPAHG